MKPTRKPRAKQAGRTRSAPARSNGQAQAQTNGDGHAEASAESLSRATACKIKNGHIDAEPAVNGHTKDGAHDLETGVVIPKKADAQAVEWFDPPDIPRGFLTVITGAPSAGKSSYLVSLAAKAEHPVLFHGDDHYAKTVVPRLVAARVPLKKVRCIAASEKWRLPSGEDKLKALIRKNRIDIVVFDPIDDYCDDGFDEDKTDPVRKLLKALMRVAEECNVAVVIVRHPGKDPANLLPGSRSWRSLPRLILELLVEEENPPAGVFRHCKNHVGDRPPDRRYTLQGPPKQHKQWVWGDAVDAIQARHLAEVPDRLDRTKIGQAQAVLRGVLGDREWHSGKQLYLKCGELQLNDRTVRRALEREKVEERANGKAGGEFDYEYRLPEKRL